MHRAILIMLVAMSLIPLGDTAGKLMTDQSALSPFFAAWSRFAVGALILAFFVRRAAYKPVSYTHLTLPTNREV